MKKLIFTICFLSMVFVGCEDDPALNPDAFTEFTADINGSWKIDQVTQNGRDITDLMDFRSFSLDLNYEGSNPSTFSLSDLTIPFITTISDGTWSFDDPTYPTTINFSDGASAQFSEPVLSKGKTLTISVPLGCGNNTYIYKLSK